MASYTQTSNLVDLIKHASNRIYCASEVGGWDISNEEYNQLTKEDKLECEKKFLNQKFDKIIANLEKDISSLITEKTNVNTPDKYSTTPLMIATLAGFDTIVKMLIDHGANVQIKDKRGLSALDHYDMKNVLYLIGWLEPLLLVIEKEFFERNSHDRCAKLLREAKCPSTDSKEIYQILGGNTPTFLPTLEKVRSNNLTPLNILEETLKNLNQK